MHKLGSSLVLSVILLAATSVFAQERQRVSPHETVNATVAGDELTVVYGRPRTKDPKSGEERKIWGGLVPYGQVWRMGADEATLFTTKKDIQMGDTTIPAGTYSLYLLPTETDAKLIVNKQTGQWGTKYDQAQDLARIDMKRAPLEDPVDQFTIEISETNAAGVLKLAWEETEYSVSFTPKS
ncbi:MAG: DUF2911 domain-containing protein [Verrucomicrobiota bacterium]|nr:DUF2911 domain-containing protein [Verrucomicrobiota bacterium]